MTRNWKIGLVLGSLGAASTFAAVGVKLQRQAIHPDVVDAGARVTLPNGWRLTPAGALVSLPGDMPVAIRTTSDGKYALVCTSGYHGHSLSVVDLASNSITQTVALGTCGPGLAFDEAAGEVYVAGGAPAGRKQGKVESIAGADTLPDGDSGPILRLKFNDGRLVAQTPIALPTPEEQRYVAGLAATGDGAIYALNIQTDELFKLRAAGGAPTASAKLGYRPLAVVRSPNGKELAVANWGGKSVSLLDAATLTVTRTVEVGELPCALAYAPDGRLFVANSGSNTVSVVSDGVVIETVRTSLEPRDPIGSSPIAMAIDSTGKRLYVANADNNDVAVIDVARPGNSEVLGFIPTARYPSAISITPDGKRLLIATAKGHTSSSNMTPAERQPGYVPDHSKPVPVVYVEDLLQGELAFVNVPTGGQLRKYTDQVRQNRPVGAVASPVLDRRAAERALHKIKHVIYVIRENRTYDQVLGDVKEGNGDPNLVMFGEKITPNSHRLVHDFVLLDNTYCDGEVSQIGHQWTDAAYATDYNEKETIISYSGRTEIKSDPRVNSSPAGYLWDDALKHGRTARIYGEYVKWQEDHNSAHGEVKKDPEKFGCSAAFEKVFARGGRDTEKVDVFLSEMRAAERTGKWPNFMVMALPEDHTSGATPGRHTPAACVANNDLALGRLVDGVSHSRFWGETAIFVIQDDAQNGCDHVDCHRTVGLVISPYTRTGAVDGTMYSTSSMIRTMEIILGLPPMTQYDAAATPMYAAFAATPKLDPYDALPAQVDVDAMNPPRGELAERSKKLDFSDIDRADPAEFNAILWQMMCPGRPEPAPVHGRLER